MRGILNVKICGTGCTKLTAGISFEADGGRPPKGVQRYTIIALSIFRIKAISEYEYVAMLNCLGPKKCNGCTFALVLAIGLMYYSRALSQPSNQTYANNARAAAAKRSPKIL